MKTAQSFVQWFLLGMGSVLGISQTLPPTQCAVGPVEAIGGDFRAVGNDLRRVMRTHPATVETAKTLGHKAHQLELAGLR